MACFNLLKRNKINILRYGVLLSPERLSSMSSNSSVKQFVQITPETESSKYLCKDIVVRDGFITEIEEKSLLDELHPYLKRLRYEYDHWDNAIHGFKETERLHWNDQNKLILQRIKNEAFPASVALLPHVHVLDLAENGYIKPHIDSVKFCGGIIAGLSLLSDCVMRFVEDRNKETVIDVLLKRRSLYIMRGRIRYEFTHEVLANETSYFKDVKVEKTRRISIICRSEPELEP